MSKLQPSPEPAGEPQVLVRPARERGRERKRELAWKQPQNKAERSLVGFCFLSSPPNLLSSFLRHPEQLPPVAGAIEEQDAGLRRLAFQDDRPGPSAARGDPAPGRYGSTAAAGSPRPRREDVLPTAETDAELLLALPPDTRQPAAATVIEKRIQKKKKKKKKNRKNKRGYCEDARTGVTAQLVRRS
eukprot:SAG31_NODE_21_length_34109_cov_60.598824_28_plen_187_part_00